MPRGGSKPGERRGGRRYPGIKNKKTLKADAFLAKGGFANAAVVQKDFSAIDRMEEIATIYFDELDREQKKGAKADPKKLEYFRGKALFALDKLAPYKHPRLSAVKMDTTVKHDLSQLSDGELVVLRRLLTKTAIE